MDVPPIDVTLLRQRTLENDALTTDLLRLFRQHALPAKAKLLMSAAENNPDDARAAVHQLRSSAATIGANRLARLLKVAETELSARNLTLTLTLLPAIGSEVDACLEQIDALLHE